MTVPLFVLAGLNIVLCLNIEKLRNSVMPGVSTESPFSSLSFIEDGSKAMVVHEGVPYLDPPAGLFVFSPEKYQIGNVLPCHSLKDSKTYRMLKRSKQCNILEHKVQTNMVLAANTPYPLCAGNDLIFSYAAPIFFAAIRQLHHLFLNTSSLCVLLIYLMANLELMYPVLVWEDISCVQYFLSDILNKLMFKIKLKKENRSFLVSVLADRDPKTRVKCTVTV